MFIIDINYTASLEEIDKHMFDHVRYLQQHYENDIFIASGRKVPRTGGIILCVADDEKEVNRIINDDPFFIHKLAEFKVTEFLTSQTHPALETLLTRPKV
ncbi:GTP cyclohydrolase [Dyadobacter luteus]|jgi:uncharacterized protein YciI|uniref:GTP cyclohydrolase n=1 Tax=Dyadobacter luteus TaxID=2259619 RepID=A0A3D8Y7N0_9BACT|nr:YciI family protein [Dyadobacter luteus]REA58517.1 GTP cyclohydrolase [Dyadobacter luteus]